MDKYAVPMIDGCVVEVDFVVKRRGRAGTCPPLDEPAAEIPSGYFWPLCIAIHMSIQLPVAGGGLNDSSWLGTGIPLVGLSVSFSRNEN